MAGRLHGLAADCRGSHQHLSGDETLAYFFIGAVALSGYCPVRGGDAISLLSTARAERLRTAYADARMRFPVWLWTFGLTGL